MWMDLDLCNTTRFGVKYSTCTWYLYLSTYLSVLDVLEYLVLSRYFQSTIYKKCLTYYRLDGALDNHYNGFMSTCT